MAVLVKTSEVPCRPKLQRQRANKSAEDCAIAATTDPSGTGGLSLLNPDVAAFASFVMSAAIVRTLALLPSDVSAASSFSGERPAMNTSAPRLSAAFAT